MTGEVNLTNVFMQAPAAMAILEGPDHIFRLANEKYMQLVGIGRSIIGLPVKKALPETTHAGFLELLDDVFRTGHPHYGHEVSVFLDRKGNGQLEEAFVDFVYQPYLKGNGDIIGVLVHAVDITEQVVLRKKAEQSEQRLRNLISEAHVATAVYIGREMKIAYANDAMIRVWGKDRLVIGKTLKEALPELEGQPFHELLENVFTTGKLYWGKEDKVDLIVNGRLETGYFNFTYTPLRDIDGQIYGILNMAIDVTEQFLYKTRVERSEATLKNLILTAPVAMCVLLGPSHVIETANDKMIELWGKPRESVMKRPIFEALPDAREQGLEPLMAKVFKTGEAFYANERPISLIRGGKRETVFLNFVYEPYRNTDGEIIGVLVISIDVSDQVKARQRIEEIVADRTAQLAEANLDLQRSNDQLSQFAYIASHDLQEPARKIVTFVDLLEKSMPHPDPRVKRYIEKIDSSATRMLALIRDVLAFSQVSNASRERSTIDLNSVLGEVQHDFELVIAEKQASIESDSLPAIEGIPVQIGQLFGNLISNSLKFTAIDRKPRIAIRSRSLHTDEVRRNRALNPQLSYCQIDFIDNGIGFSQSNADQIFDIFQRLHGRAEFEGTGIGLAICRKIVQNHDGDIWADSTIGEGATFHVILPAKTSND
ncbi:MAG TPA: PAS domain-containing protein [Chryseosolibacter sp.]|nr:PAS domain-containing protein [Chryseosolibacter sp.]